MNLRLVNAVDEFDGQRHAFLAAQLGLAVSDQVRQAALLPDWELLVATRVRTLLANGDSTTALDLLHERSDRLDASELTVLETEALVTLDRTADARDVLDSAIDRAEAAGLPQTVYALARLGCEVMIVQELWTWSWRISDRLERLAAVTGHPSHRLAAAAAGRAARREDRLKGPDPDQAFEDAFDAVGDSELVAEPELAALAGAQLRTGDQAARVVRLLRLVGLSRRDEGALRRMCGQLAQFDRAEFGGQLARRLGAPERKSGTESWSALLLESTETEATASLVLVLEQYASELPDALVATVSDILGTEMLPARWYPVVIPAGSAPPTAPGDTSPATAPPPGVSGKTTALLEDRLADLFSLEQMRQFLALQFDLSLDSVVNAGNNLREVVFALVHYFDQQGRLAELVARAREVAPSDPGLIEVADQLGVSTLTSPGNASEAVVRDHSSLGPDAWLQRLGQIEGQVCRVEWRSQQQAVGTGFLVGEDLVLTAAHVLGTGSQAIDLRFDYTETTGGQTLTSGTVFSVDKVLVSDTQDDGLDFAVLAVRGSPGVQPVGGVSKVGGAPRGWIELGGWPLDPPVGSSLAMAHYPTGDRLKAHHHGERGDQLRGRWHPAVPPAGNRARLVGRADLRYRTGPYRNATWRGEEGDRHYRRQGLRRADLGSPPWTRRPRSWVHVRLHPSLTSFRRTSMTVVDIHCHTFNADDLPVQGFVKAVGGSRHWLAGALAWSLDKVTQGLASGQEEITELDRLIRQGPALEEALPPSGLEVVDREADALLARLQAENPVLADNAAREAASDPGSTAGTGPGLESLQDRAEALRRYLRWVALFGRTRLELTRALVELYPEVNVFTPLLVDFQGLGDQPKTAVLQQLELQERLSRMSILGHFRATVLPFVGFDPRRLGALPLAQLAVATYGFVGVKLYPSVGFLPIGNLEERPEGMAEEEAVGVEHALNELYAWCEAAQVPITAHTNPTIYARQSFQNNSSPEHWERVLQRWPDLHLNLGHFGWAGPDWPDRISALMATYPHLHADIGNHDLADLSATIDRLEGLFADPATGTARERSLFGTDWFMVASHHRYPQFLTEIRDRYAERFPNDVDAFMGGNALSFLGFDDPANGNTVRLRARYAQHLVTPPAWLADT